MLKMYCWRNKVILKLNSKLFPYV